MDNQIRRGWTPLHFACQNESPEEVHKLIAEGADINALTACGSTPLSIACQPQRSTECTRVLLAVGADVNIPGPEGLTLLHTECSYGMSSKYIEWLLDAGADVNAQTNTGWTPLHIACLSNDEAMVTLLLESGADASIINNHGKLPSDLTVIQQIKYLLNNFGLNGGCSTKAAMDWE
jgi:ankyrin repeat protein